MRLGRFLLFLLFALPMLSVTVVVDAQQDAALAGRWGGMLIPKREKEAASKELGWTRGITKLAVVVAIKAASDGRLSGTWSSAGPQGATAVELGVDGDSVH